MKEIRNLTTKNGYFGEIEYENLTKEMKPKALLVLMFVVAKRNREIKLRGVANRSFQQLYTNREDCSLPTLGFYAFKYICGIIAKESRDVVTVDLPGFFLHTEKEGIVVIIGRGAMVSFSRKLGLVTNSSTETEVVSNGERFPKCT